MPVIKRVLRLGGCAWRSMSRKKTTLKISSAICFVLGMLLCNGHLQPHRRPQGHRRQHPCVHSRSSIYKIHNGFQASNTAEADVRGGNVLRRWKLGYLCRQGQAQALKSVFA